MSLDGLTIGVTTCYQLPGAIGTFCGSWFHVAPAVQLALALHGVKVHTVHQHLVAIPTTQSSRTPSIYTIFPELRALRRKHSQEEPADFELSLSLFLVGPAPMELTATAMCSCASLFSSATVFRIESFEEFLSFNRRRSSDLERRRSLLADPQREIIKKAQTGQASCRAATFIAASFSMFRLLACALCAQSGFNTLHNWRRMMR